MNQQETEETERNHSKSPPNSNLFFVRISCNTVSDYQIVADVARTLELTVPLIKHPSEIFLSQLEEDAVK